MRGVLHILMATLIVAALFCGNCLSCPEVLIAMAGNQPGHSCCHHRTAKIDCHSGQFSHFVKAQGGNAAPVFAVAAAAPAMAKAAPAPTMVTTLGSAETPPPDLISLNSLLRI